jgi:hypothetical protein
VSTEQPWPWPPTLDALQAAPASHRVLLDNDGVRVLEVMIEPGTREPEHPQQAPSVMIVDEPARIRYYAGGTVLLSPSRLPGPRPRYAYAGWSPRARTRSRTSTSAAITQSESNSGNAGTTLSPARRAAGSIAAGVSVSGPCW